MQRARASARVLLPALLLVSAPWASGEAAAPAAKAGAKAKPKPEEAPAADPIARDVAAAIRAKASGKLAKFYGQRGYWPLWVRAGKLGSAPDQLVELLATADLDGLDPDRYKIDRLRRTVKDADGGDAEALARAELLLSTSFAAYVRDMRRPARSVKITYLDPELTPAPPGEDDVLRAAALAPSFATYLTGMGWMSPLYASRRAALGKYLEGGGSAAGERRLRLNLDRARILPSAWTRHVVVDAASARLWVFGDGKQQGTMRVVVGTAETQTPMLAGMVRYATLNPYWNVPSDLVERKVAPRMLKGASFRTLRYEALSDWSADATKLDPATIDWTAVAAGEREVRVRQLPGAGNAMGRVKFMFPNDLGIYLHDTPDRALMKKPARQFSNGCVRLEDAGMLGRWFFGKPLATSARTPEQHRPLPQPVPVYLTYLTAAPTEKGVAFLKDVYGRDGEAGD
jgi:murein L,D-transpeptidase YcbB/YkuD